MKTKIEFVYDSRLPKFFGTRYCLSGPFGQQTNWLRLRVGYQEQEVKSVGDDMNTVGTVRGKRFIEGRIAMPRRLEDEKKIYEILRDNPFEITIHTYSVEKDKRLNAKATNCVAVQLEKDDKEVVVVFVAHMFFPWKELPCTTGSLSQ